MAQTPETKSLLSEGTKSLFAGGAVRMESQNVVDMQGPGMNNKMTINVKMASGNGKFRMDMTPMGVSVVSDGESAYVWMAPLNQYMKMPAPSSPDSLAEALMPGAAGTAGNIKDRLSATIARIEPIDFAGKKVECYVIESKLDSAELSAQPPVSIGNLRQTAWVDKDRKLALKQISDMEMQMGGAASPMKIHSEMTVTLLDFSPVFAPDEFKFVPPDDAKLVDSLPGLQNLKFEK